MEMKKKPKAQRSVNVKKNSFENDAWMNNSVVVGIDEVGRGCLAGPLVTAAVILPPHTTYYQLKDSKIMTAQEREKAFRWIQKKCSYGVGIVHNRIVDKHNVWHTTLIAMKKALLNLIESSPYCPSAILIDAMPLDISDTHICDIPVYHFYYGEKKSSSIAAASIVAKVIRDALMNDFDRIIPGYKWTTNKGYGTPVHKSIVRQELPSILHRERFLKNVMLQKDLCNMQLSFDTLEEDFIEENDGDETEMFCGGD